uniref:Uncharacterized protein n=1 Tax=Ciona intestinalis TaxID=7719 RepID=H2Y158_CIOIN
MFVFGKVIILFLGVWMAAAQQSQEAERTTGASVVDTTSPQSNVTSFPDIYIVTTDNVATFYLS